MSLRWNMNHVLRRRHGRYGTLTSTIGTTTTMINHDHNVLRLQQLQPRQPPTIQLVRTLSTTVTTTSCSSTPLYLNVESKSSSNSSRYFSSSTITNTKQQTEQYLYMWGTDQYGTIWSPMKEDTSKTTETTTTTTTKTTTSSTIPPSAAVASTANTNQKYDLPTMIDPIAWRKNPDNSNTNNTNTTMIEQIICGPTETAILLSNGNCYMTGKNEYGQCGLQHTKPVVIPTLINTQFDMIYESNDNGTTTPNTKIRQVALGTNFAAYLVEPPTSSTDSSSRCHTKGYDLYTCGFGGSTLAGVGCLGHGTIDSTTIPKLVESIYEDNIYIQQVVAGDAHCTILTMDGEILTTGSGSYGRLGNFDTTDQLYFEPVEMVVPSSESESESQIIQIAGGKSFTLALSKDGIVYGWGRNHKGQLGTGYGLAVDMYAMQSVPESISETSDLLSNTTIRKIAAGHSHAACLSTSGEVYHWGMSLHLEPVLVDSLLHTKIVDIVCGEDYTFAIDVHGHMYSFGNGNYTLGHGKDIRQLNVAKKIEAFRTGIEEIDEDSSNVTKLIQRKIIHAAAGWKHAAVLLQEEHIDKPKDYATII